MRIAYLVHLNLGPESGVFKKIICQASAWNERGHTVKLFVITREKNVATSITGSYSEVDVAEYAPGISARSIHSRLQAFSNAAKLVSDWKPDIVYTRQDLHYRPIIEVAKCFPLVVEINTNDLKELALGRKLNWFYHLFTRRFILKSATGYVFVSKELSALPSYSKYRKPFVVIGNGIALDKIAPLSAPRRSGVRLVFIGHSGCPWHGVDKIIDLARARPDWHIDIVGIAPDSVHHTPKNVTYHGPMSRNEYVRVLAEADCALGTLALYRAGMSEASPLKTREYLAYGLPVIIGYQDTDFPNGADFLLQIPNRSDSIEVSLDEIDEFVSKWKGKRVPREAIAHLEDSTKEDVRLAFFESLITGNNRS